jgi:type IV fimbrial biogenesis protein FimT
MLTKTSPPERSAGFTLIELMIAVALLAILLTIGLPSFQQMMRNYEVRVAAESVANGLQRARAEAVAKNARVQFVLGAGTSWYVDFVATPNPAARLDSRASTDGSTNATLTVLPVGATTLTFNQLGQMLTPNPADGSDPGSAPLTQVNFAATGGNQNLRIIIGAGGNARVCDPGLPSSNVRACP